MEILDIVDENGIPTGETIERNVAHREGIRHRTSHVWLVRKKNNRIQILLQKRCATKDSYPGCYDISSAGHIPEGCGFHESAVRELKEELGIDILEEELVYCGDRTIITDTKFNHIPFHDNQVSRVFLLWKDIEEKDFILQKEEVESVLWMDFEECIKSVKENSIPNCIVPEELTMLHSILFCDDDISSSNRD